MTNEILLVDDNSDIRQLISGILRDKGFNEARIKDPLWVLRN